MQTAFMPAYVCAHIHVHMPGLASHAGSLILKPSAKRRSSTLRFKCFRVGSKDSVHWRRSQDRDKHDLV